MTYIFHEEKIREIFQDISPIFHFKLTFERRLFHLVIDVFSLFLGTNHVCEYEGETPPPPPLIENT